jgi:hypothetical protein
MGAPELLGEVTTKLPHHRRLMVPDSSPEVARGRDPCRESRTRGTGPQTYDIAGQRTCVEVNLLAMLSTICVF